MPTFNQWLQLFVMGITTQGLAYFCWDIGAKHGNIQLLSILSYGNPILSVSFLACFGLAAMSVKLAISALMVSTAGLIASVEWRKPKLVLSRTKIANDRLLE